MSANKPLRKLIYVFCWMVLLVCAYQVYNGQYFAACLGIAGSGILLIDLLCTSPVDVNDQNNRQL